jgi:hypothetical protein
VWSKRSIGTISERHNTLLCAVDPKRTRVTPYDIHERVYDNMCLRENEVSMVQIDGPRRHVYIKFRDFNRMQDILHLTQGHGEYRHMNGKLSTLRIEAAELGTRRIRITNIPPEVPEGAVRTVLARYGEVKEMM